jgi:BirA family biotin operon repressor/biotin-[acetyl-CoA-carboxylase] ligase
MADGPATRPRAAQRTAPQTRELARPPQGWAIRHFETVDSTNRVLLDAAREGAAAGTVVVADHQDAGRGRRGRTWESAPGESLLVSVLLRPRVPVERAHLVTIAAALALADAVEHATGISVTLKWPNDLLVGERKLAGLLAEAEVAAGETRALVVGAGCNLAQRTFPPAIAELATSCAIESGAAPDRDLVLDAFLAGLGARLEDLDAVVGEHRDRLATLGRHVRVDLDGHTVEGVATEVDADGRLVVTPERGSPIVVAAGDVVHLRTR